jgi:hypothetical protein
MPSGAALSGGSAGENITHFGGIRIRVNGTGSLRMSLYSLDDVVSSTLVPITMATTTRIIPTRLCNFQEHRALLQLQTTAIDEFMSVNRIIVFTKVVFSEWPSTMYT